MSKLLKSKFLLGVLVVAVMLVGVAAFASTASADTCTITKTLKLGSKGVEVQCLQTTLNLKADGSFGAKTKAAVIAWQKSKNLTADGVFGAKSRAAFTGVSVGGNCTTAFDPMTGKPCVPGNVPPVTGPVSVMLATDNPASGNVVSPSTGAVFAKYTFTGTGTVTSLKLLRTGISQNANLSNVYLYDGATRLTDGASFNSDNSATFNNTSGLFTVSGTKVISVVADLAAVGSDYGYSAAVSLVSFTSGGLVSTVNVVGNVQYIASATTATVDFGTVTPTGGSIDPAKDVVVFNSSVSVGTRDVSFTRLAMRQIGSVNNGDIANFRLMVDGATVATVANMDSNGYVTFVLPAPKILKTGTRVVKVLADVNGGSSRTFQFSIRNKTDLGLLDTQYDAGIAATFSSGNFPASPVAATSINSGSVTVQKSSDSTSGNVTLNGSDVVLARYTLTTYGESLKIENVKAGFTYTDNSGAENAAASLRNGRIMINGAQVGSTATLLAAGTTYTTNYVLEAGMPATLEIRADIYDNDGTVAIAATDTILATLMSSTSNTQRQSSLGYITVPASNVPGNSVTARSAASLTMAKTSTYGNQTTAVPQNSPYKIASYSLSGNNVEDVNLDTVSVDFTAVSGATFTSADLTDVVLKINGEVIGSPKQTVSATGNSYSITKVLPKNGTMLVEFWANIGSTITATHSIKSTTTVSGVGAASSVASTTGAVDSQTITANTGSLTATAESKPDEALNDDAGTKTMAVFKFEAVTDSYTVTDLTFTIADVTTVSQMSLYEGDNTTPIVTKTAAATTTFDGLSWSVPAGQVKLLKVKLDLGTVGVGAGSTGASTLVTLTSGTATDGAGTSASITESNPAGKAQYVYKAIPTLSTVSLPTTALVAGVNTLSKFAVSTNGTGPIGWNRIIFTVTKVAAPVLSSFKLYNADTGSEVAGTATILDSASAATCDATVTACLVSFVPTSEEQVTGSTNYVLKADVSGTLATANYVSTAIKTKTTPAYAASAAYSTVAAVGGGFDTYAHGLLGSSFIWSDLSASSHSTTTLDWTGDYLVRSLPLDSQTLTK